FFFQAEDGIRDFHVTGVQTCALPISFPHEAHPMQILASATSALATYYPDALDPLDETAVDISSRRLIAKLPTMVSWSYKYRVHQPYVYPRNDLEYSSRFLHTMFSVRSEESRVGKE